MLRKDLERIVKTFYDALEDGKVLGRKCTRCGHIEYPPYLACNNCGNLKTEWVELSGKSVCNQILPPPQAFFEPELEARVGKYWHGSIRPENCDDTSSILVNIKPEKYEQARANLPLEVRPVIVQDLDTKVVYWEFVDDAYRAQDVFRELGGFQSVPETEESSAAASVETEIDMSTDPVAIVVLEAAADAYGVDQSELTMATDIREDLANESMKMIVMMSEIEDELDVSIEIREAANLNTLGDFVRAVKEKM